MMARAGGVNLAPQHSATRRTFSLAKSMPWRSHSFSAANQAKADVAVADRPY